MCLISLFVIKSLTKTKQQCQNSKPVNAICYYNARICHSQFWTSTLIISIDFDSESSLASIKNKNVYSNILARNFISCHLKKTSLNDTQMHNTKPKLEVKTRTVFYQNICERIKWYNYGIFSFIVSSQFR
jgi:hypothetical protein